jgi:geranylgeranyl diphosphate synthase type II
MYTFKQYSQEKIKVVNKALNGYIKQIKNAPQIMTDSMSYSVNAGGKRLRPMLVLLAAECFGLKPSKALPCACAVEMIHTYSLIHDDLPCLDNDNLRRGKPTNHKIFGQDLAMLAGDGLLTYAFETAAKNAKHTGTANTLKAIEYLAYSAGVNGMAGGQTADIYAEGLTKKSGARIRKLLKKSCFKNKKLNYFLLPKNKKFTKQNLLFYIHAHKTAELIKASVQAGAALAGAGRADFKRITDYGYSIGMAFQITDDILDATKSAERLGKSTSDEKMKKLTFVTLFGLKNAEKQAQKIVSEAKKALDKIKTAGRKIKTLYDLSDFILKRNL